MKASKAHWDTVVVWFRRDLRIADQPSLREATERARLVVPLFVLDERLVAISPVRAAFLAGSLRSLHGALSDLGSGLLVRSGQAEEVVPQVAQEFGAGAVLATRDVTPLSYRRDAAVAARLRAQGRELHLRPGLLLAEPEMIHSASRRPYRVFGPFWRSLQAAPRRPLSAAPVRVPGPAVLATSLRLPDSMTGPRPAALPEPGEDAAAQRLRRWVQGPLSAYEDGRDELSGRNTSHLGADLRFGLLSPLQVETAASEIGTGNPAFVRQLAWREFYHHLLFHRRAAGRQAPDDSLMSAFRQEADDPDAVAAWKAGQTGIPTVDAAMRQLAATAWMSNRARLVVASFLTRHLLMDYRVGERHFLRHLIDGDVANNLGGWQWSAGVGADPQPWFRVFNPVRQGVRFDPDGGWIREWLPELRAVPTEYIHTPWEMPSDVAAASGVTLGQEYPWPIVDLASGRDRALASFKAARRSGQG